MASTVILFSCVLSKPFFLRRYPNNGNIALDIRHSRPLLELVMVCNSTQAFVTARHYVQQNLSNVPALICSPPSRRTLHQIVKNEARTIAGVVAAAAPWINHYTIVDTGSTDDTVGEVRRGLEGVPGKIHRAPFVDFATTRNYALRLAGKRCVFSLMLSGDEYLKNGNQLIDFLEQRRKKSNRQFNGSLYDDAFNVRVHYGSSLIYDSTRIVRTDADWYYVGTTHEYMTNKEGNIAQSRVEMTNDNSLLEDAFIYHNVTGDADVKRRRWLLDRKLLLIEWNREPNNPRTAFYLGQSSECLGDFEEALRWYTIRRALEGFPEERYEAWFRSARVAEALNHTWASVQQTYLDAYNLMPQRAEPLYRIARHYQQRGSHALAYLFARRAMEFPFPAMSQLFVDRDVYDYLVFDVVGTSAYYVGEYELGRIAVLRALEKRPGDHRLLQNLDSYFRTMTKGKLLNLSGISHAGRSRVGDRLLSPNHRDL